MQLDDIVLPDDLLWVDEFDWSPVTQSMALTLTGALLVESAVQLAGRPITLVGGQDYGWTTRAVVVALKAKAANPVIEMVLTLNDYRQFNVIFNHAQTAIEARDLQGYNAPDDDDHYTLTLRLLEI